MRRFRIAGLVLILAAVLLSLSLSGVTKAAPLQQTTPTLTTTPPTVTPTGTLTVTPEPGDIDHYLPLMFNSEEVVATPTPTVTGTVSGTLTVTPTNGTPSPTVTGTLPPDIGTGLGVAP